LDCRHLENVYELFLLGALSDDNVLELREHLTGGCERCQLRIKEAARTVYLLSLTTKPVLPATKVKDDLLRLVRKK
jgi:hypothetical protein